MFGFQTLDLVTTERRALPRVDGLAIIPDTLNPELAAERLTALDRTIADLEDARAALRRLAKACNSKDSGPCPIIAAFQG